MKIKGGFLQKYNFFRDFTNLSYTPIDRQVMTIGGTNIAAEVKTQSIVPFVIIGYQRSKLYEKFEIFYGIDVLVKYLNIKNDSIFITTIPAVPSGFISYLYPKNINGMSIGANSFIGLRYPLGNHFAISTEMALAATFSKTTYRMIGESYPTPLPPTQVGRAEIDAERYSCRVNILPFYVLNLSYNF